jgi:hypothetical protein
LAANTLTVIFPGDRIEVLDMPFARRNLGPGVQGTVEAVQDLAPDTATMSTRATVRADDGRKLLVIIPPDRIKIIRKP